MSAGLRLGVLDQSPIISGHTPAEAVRETIALAVEAEKLGYSRYWLAEHHAITALADPCPEILVAAGAAATSHIRVGTGGVLLPYYSPLKTAEVFRMLEALYPGRIDLGIGRAPGGDMTTARAMGGGQYAGAEDFPAQVQDLVGFLDDTLPADHPFARVKAMPSGPSAPQVWLLGSSDYSAALSVVDETNRSLTSAGLALNAAFDMARYALWVAALFALLSGAMAVYTLARMDRDTTT